MVGEFYAYYRDTRLGALQHLLGVNWVLIWLESKMKSWEVILSFQCEVDFGILGPTPSPPSRIPKPAITASGSSR